MSAARLSRQEKKKATRARLLDAAAEVISRKGFAATTVDQVAQRAGLTKGAVYSNFASKEALFLAVIDRHVGQRTATITAFTESDVPISERIAQAGQLFVGALTEDPKWFLLGLEFAMYAARNPHVTPRLGAGYRNLRSQVADRLEEHARNQGRPLALPADQLATTLFALSNGLALERLGDPDAVPDQLFGSVLGIFFETEPGGVRVPAR